MNRKAAPDISFARLLRVHDVLLRLTEEGRTTITSGELAEAINATAASIRRDVVRLGILGPSRTGYRVQDLEVLIRDSLRLEDRVPTCVVGLEGIGHALVRKDIWPAPLDVVAGFDSSVNRLETMSAPVPLFPAYQIEEVVPRLGIRMALLCGGGIRESLERLERAGVASVLNLGEQSPPSFHTSMTVLDLALMDEARRLAVTTNLKEKST